MTYIEQARAAVDAVTEARAAVSAADAKLTELRRLERTEQDEREQLRAEEDEAEALRQLDGDTAAPENRRRLKRLAELDKSVPARAAAIRLQLGRLGTAAAELRQAQNALTAPVLHVIAELQRDASESIRSILAQAAPEFSRLIAAEQIRNALLGDRFAVPEGCPVPIGGLKIVRTFSESLPDRIKAPELTETLLFEAAHAVSSEIIKQIKG
ncbi:hypothetical protein [Novosphingobium mathurense]|uniref:Uncharacterized protein n=1 Tax=Novosphingobium mathurense TaxID=428990 RepID=A0A1U6GXY9_9SPHN|nr:hypothetical protein [Novosphingobium mathurense]SLJ88357.1 hypothetical protein SAMN06295987_101794 [Novosphingobium mathurense]